MNQDVPLADTGSMKLVFVATKCEDQTHFLDLIKICVRKLRKETICSVAKEVHFEEPIQIGTSKELCRIDCPIKVKSKTLWLCFQAMSHQLTAEMKSFAKDHLSEKLQFQSSVQIQDRAFFDIGQLHGADLEVNAEEVYFGNLIKHDTFISHYNVDNKPNNGWYGTAEQMQYYFNKIEDIDFRPKKRNEKNPNERDSIFVDFEHDRRRLFIIFPIKWPDVVQDDKGKSQEKVAGVAKLLIGYNTIRRIFCDFEVAGGVEQSLNMYLHLTAPPLISIVKFDRRNKERKKVRQVQSDLRTILGDRYTHWLPLKSPGYKEAVRAVAESPYLKIKFKKDMIENFVHVVGRLFAVSHRPIEIRNIVPYKQKDVTYPYLKSPLEDNELRNKLLLNKSAKDREDFAVVYMLDALLSRGAHVKDQLLVVEEHRSLFINRLMELYTDKSYPNSRRLTLESLERLLNTCDELLDMRPLYELFEESIVKAKNQIESEDPEKSLDKRGYIRLRKVTITPTRFIFEAPELIMGNRVLRADPENFPPERFMRVAFRDDDWTRIKATAGKAFIKAFVMRALRDGIVAGNYYHPIDGKRYHRVFNYLGSSNSQMREQGCYFIQANDQEIGQFRQSLGSFKKESVPKLMARFGQCFTQSQVPDKVLERSRYNFAVEYTGGSDSRGKEYTYSDGVGCMSQRFADEISKQMKLGDFRPSCIQARFRGFKGVTSVNPTMDLLRKWADKHGIDESLKKDSNRIYNVDLLFRGSQCKFRAPQTNQRYEVVKLSGPSPVALNRPLINILDQVSAMQGFVCHRTVTNRIFQLLDLQLQQIARTMTEETAARSRLGEFPRVVMFDELRNLNLTQEPFFCAMLRTAARCTLKKLRSKLQVAIPDNLGRSMLGVVDETGTLNYGQVYIRYTVNMQQKRPGKAAARITHTGPVLITKNPMIVAGDVRMFEAVDIPALEHMCDVVVFPRNGPRPHPDEMAGSDLDGDEYSVIWDPQLFLNHNEAAFDYTPDKVDSIVVDEDKLRDQMANFFVEYITHDSIGTLAIAFLVNSDIYGIESEVCDIVAKKHMQAVDFPKTGQPPRRLERSRPEQGITGEDPPRKPDFMEQVYKPTYSSPRLNGRIFRRIKAIDDVLEISIEDHLNQPAKADETFDIEGGVAEKYMEIARTNFGKYKATLENLLQRFGIASEVEIFSNSYSVMRKRISDKEEDDFSFFNTQRIIEEEIENIYSTHRRQLFETFGGNFHSQTEWPYKTSCKNERETRLILRKVVREPSVELQHLAVAYYKVAYTQDDQKFLSFAWLGADILSRVRQTRIFQLRKEHEKFVGTKETMPSNYSFAFDPLSNRIHQHILDFIKFRSGEFDKFSKKIDEWYNNQRNKEFYAQIRAYCERHEGLKELLFFCYKWARKSNLLADEPTVRSPEERQRLRLEPGGAPAYTLLTISLTFIQFGLDEFGGGVRTPNKPFLEETKIVKLDPNSEYLINPKMVHEVNLFEQHGGLGCKFLQFLRFCSTLDFGRLKIQSFVKFELYTTFATQQHVRLHKAAESSYYKLCFTDDFTTLPYSKGRQDIKKPSTQNDLRPVVDGESFVFELPTARCGQFIQQKQRRDAIIRKTGIDDFDVRSLPSRESDMTSQFVVTVTGSLESVNSLRRLLVPSGYINCQMTESMLANALSSQVFHRLLQIHPPNDAEKKFLENYHRRCYRQNEN